jgi:hypothetical protein
MNSIPKDFGISRIDQPDKKNHGWYVRISLNGETWLKFFPDKKLGGKRHSRKAAEVYRNQIVAKLPEERVGQITRRRRRIPQSAVVGVTHVEIRALSGKTYRSWQAGWQDAEGRRRTRKFSVARYGGDEARKKAEGRL